MSEATKAEPSEIEKAFAWLVDNSDGIVGLKADGTVMPWQEVLNLYVPWWSAGFMDKEVRRHTGDMPSCQTCGADIDEESGICVTELILGPHDDSDDDA